MAEARRLNPSSTALLADYAMVLALSGARAKGLALLGQIARDRPDQLSARAYLAELALSAHDGRGYLTEEAEVVRLRRDPALAACYRADRAAFARAGMAALLATRYARAAADAAKGRGAFLAARIAALRGDLPGTLGALRIAAAAHETDLASLPSDPAFAGLRSQPALARMMERPSLAP